MSEKKDSTIMNRFRVRWAGELIKHLSTEGRNLKPGETIRVTKGLPEDAELVEVALSSSDRSVLFTFESQEEMIIDEVRVEHSVEQVYGKVPVAAIRLAVGACGLIEANQQELEAARHVQQWLERLDRVGS